jgi:hypothetical protein
MTRYFLIVFALATLLPVHARAGAGWTDHVEVIELIPTGLFYYEIHLLGGDHSSGCREKDWYYLIYDTPGANKMFYLFVDSMQSKLRLKVYVNGLCNLKGYSEVSAVSASPIGRLKRDKD